MPTRTSPTRAWLFSLAAVALLLSGCQSRKPSVVLITVSGLGDSVVTLDSMPSLSASPAPGRLAGVIAPAPDAVLSAAALMTGTSIPASAQPDRYRIPATTGTLAERLHREGYYTAAWIGYGDLSARQGFARGFDRYESIVYPLAQPVMPDEPNRVRPSSGGFVPAPAMAEQFGAWLKDNRDKSPFCVWLHLGDPSQAVNESAEGSEAHAYREALTSVDAALKYVRDSLRTYGSEDTVVAIVGLHGESLGEAGELSHGIALHPTSYKVAAAIAGGAGANPGGGGSIADLFATLLSAVGLPPEGFTPVGTTVFSPSASRAFGWSLAPVDGARGESRVLPDGGRDLLQQLRRARRMAMHEDQPLEAIARLQAINMLAAQAPAVPYAIVHSIAALPAALRSAQQPALDAALTSLTTQAGNDRGRQFDVAHSLIAAGRPADALVLARTFVSDPDPGNQLACAEIFDAGKSIDEARPLIEAVIAAEQEAPELQEWLGDMMAASGSSYQARDAYQKAGESPRARTAFLLAKWGDALRALGDHDAALQRYAEALKVDPGYRYPHSQAAASLSAKGDTGAAAQAIAMSVAITGDPIVDAISRADALVGAGMLAAAGDEVAQAREKFPDSDMLPLALSRVYAKAENPARSKAVLEEFLAGHPESAPVLVQLARALARAGDETAAADALRRAEAEAGPGLTAVVRQDPAFQRVKGSALSKAAQSFSGRGEGRRAPSAAPSP